MRGNYREVTIGKERANAAANIGRRTHGTCSRNSCGRGFVVVRRAHERDTVVVVASMDNTCLAFGGCDCRRRNLRTPLQSCGERSERWMALRHQLWISDLDDRTSNCSAMDARPAARSGSGGDGYSRSSSHIRIDIGFAVSLDSQTLAVQT